MKPFTFLFVVFVLTACMSRDAEPSTSVPAGSDIATADQSVLASPLNSSPVASATEGASDTATAAPTATASSAATTSSLPADDEALLQRGYGTLLFLEGAATLLEEEAQRVEAGTAGDFERFAASLVIGAILQAVNESLAAEPPDPIFEESWDKASELSSEIGTLLGQWFDQEIGAAHVFAQIEPLHEEIDAMNIMAENDLARAYGVDRDEMRQLREEAMAELRANLEEGVADTGSESGTPVLGATASALVDPVRPCNFAWLSRNRRAQ